MLTNSRYQELQIKYLETFIKLRQMQDVITKQVEANAELAIKISSQKDLLEYLNRSIEQRERQIETLLSVLASRDRQV